MTKKNIAIIGSGIAGLGCAYHLRECANITIFDKNNYIGGHTNTITVNTENSSRAFDTGFMVFNHATYPNLIKLFETLNVPTVKTDMSFSVSHRALNLEWNGAGFTKLFAQPHNIISPRFWQFLLMLNRFNKQATKMGQSSETSYLTVKEFVAKHQYSQDLLDLYLTPMTGAIWSLPPDEVELFPIETIVRFFYNHGFLGLDTHHQWYTVSGGAGEYVKRILKTTNIQIELNKPVQKIIKGDVEHTLIFADGSSTTAYDLVIVATHADEALALLENPSETEKAHLSAFPYQYNHTVIHSDESVMPKTKSAWAAWNVRIDQQPDGSLNNSTHYWMNRLQHLPKSPFMAVSLNASAQIAPDKIHREIEYHHPRFTLESLKAQETIQSINTQNAQKVFFCGSYFKYGFHEDAYTSALQLVELLKPKLGVL